MTNRLALLPFLAVLAPGPLKAQTPAKTVQPLTHNCHVYAVDLAAGETLFSEMMARPNAKPEEFRVAAQKVEKILGEFKAEVGEEVATTRSYPVPGTNLTITATVFYTDEMMDLSNSMLEAVVVAKGPVENALQAPGAAIAEVNHEQDTYKVRAKQRIVIEGRPWVVGLECQCMSEEQRQKQLQAGPK